MLKKWLLYIASVILALFLSIMYYEPFPVLCLLFLMIVPFIGALIQLPLLWFIDVRFSAFDVVCEIGEGMKVKFEVKNNSYIPVFNLRIHLKTENQFSGKVQNSYIEMRLPAKTDSIVPLYLHSEECGRIRLVLEKVQIMGLVPIYSWTLSTKKLKKEVYMTVLPQIKNLSLTVSQETRRYPVDWELLKIKKDETSIYKVRPFQQGDRLQRIHWKLSAKNNEWMIREIITPEGANVLLILDWNEKSLDNLNHIMEVMISLSFALSMECCKVLLISSTNTGEWYTMNTEEDLYFIFGEMMQHNSKQDKIPLLHLLEQKCVGITFAHLYYVTDKNTDEIISLLGTTNLAYKKTFIYVGEQDTTHTTELCQQYKIEYFYMDKKCEDAIEQWDFIV